MVAFALFVSTSAYAQETSYPAGDPRVTFIDLKQEQMHAITVAWTAVHAQYEPNAAIGDFEVTYTAVVGHPPTIAFGKMHSPVGEKFHFYQVVVDGNAARIVTADQSGSLR